AVAGWHAVSEKARQGLGGGRRPRPGAAGAGVGGGGHRRRRADVRAARDVRRHRLRQEGKPALAGRSGERCKRRMTAAVDLFTIVAVSVGAFFFLAGTVGLLRFPDTMTRLHALTKADNLGLGLVVLGLLPRASGPAGALKLVCVWLLVLLGSAAVSQLIAR